MSRAFHSAAAVSVGETTSGTRPSCARWALTSVTTCAARSARSAGQVGAGTQLPAAVAAAGMPATAAALSSAASMGNRRRAKRGAGPGAPNVSAPGYPSLPPCDARLERRARRRAQRDRWIAALLGRRGEGAHAGPVLLDVRVGVVARAHERACGDVVEAQRVRGLLEGLELVGMPVAHDGQVLLGGTQVLPDGEDLDVVVAQHPERLDHLLVVSPRPTMRPDFVTTSSPPMALALRSTRSERSQRDPRRAT